jgi:hypothetical protein
MTDAIKNLISKYEAEMRQASIDQRTDDAMTSDAFRAYSDILTRVINDLKTLTYLL